MPASRDPDATPSALVYRDDHGGYYGSELRDHRAGSSAQATWSGSSSPPRPFLPPPLHSPSALAHQNSSYLRPAPCLEHPSDSIAYGTSSSDPRHFPASPSFTSFRSTLHPPSPQQQYQFPSYPPHQPSGSRISSLYPPPAFDSHPQPPPQSSYHADPYPLHLWASELSNSAQQTRVSWLPSPEALPPPPVAGGSTSTLVASSSPPATTDPQDRTAFVSKARHS